MGKVVKISENKFNKLFEEQEPYITMADDESDYDEYASYHEFEKYIVDWANHNNIEIEKLIKILKIENPMEIFFENFMS